MGCTWEDMMKKYERFICDSKVDYDIMVASDLKEFPYTTKEDEAGVVKFENSVDGETKGRSCYGFASYL